MVKNCVQLSWKAVISARKHVSQAIIIMKRRQLLRQAMLRQAMLLCDRSSMKTTGM
jgi:hypothetical protein